MGRLLVKPHFKKANGHWVCLVWDGRGNEYQFIAMTPQGAWQAFQEALRSLDRLGMSWEIFP